MWTHESEVCMHTHTDIHIQNTDPFHSNTCLFLFFTCYFLLFCSCYILAHFGIKPPSPKKALSSFFVLCFSLFSFPLKTHPLYRSCYFSLSLSTISFLSCFVATKTICSIFLKVSALDLRELRLFEAMETPHVSWSFTWDESFLLSSSLTLLSLSLFFFFFFYYYYYHLTW